MNKTLKDKWIKALRSGKYFEAKESLTDEAWVPVDPETYQPLDGYEHIAGAMGYCCLGVLCEIDPKVTKDNGAYISTHKDVLKEAQRIYDEQGPRYSIPYMPTILVDEPDAEREPTEVQLVMDDKKVIGVVVGDSDFNPLIQKHYGLDKIVKLEGHKRPMHSKLVSLNDEPGMRFPIVARYLEKVNL